MRTNSITAVALLAAATLVSATVPKVKNKKAATTKKPEIVFFDDFSGSSIDRTKWNIEVTNRGVVNNEQQAYVDSASTLYIAHGSEAQGAHDGALVINPVYHPGYVNAAGNKFD